MPMLVQVRMEEAADLDDLLEAVDGATPAGTAHPFDGETVAQVALLLSTATFPFFRTWAQSRIAARKGFKVVMDGIELSGYTSEEAVSVLKQIQQAIEAENGKSDE